jgi:hypothetical protein
MTSWLTKTKIKQLDVQSEKIDKNLQAYVKEESIFECANTNPIVIQTKCMTTEVEEVNNLFA